jgi:hypothetical protein
MRKPTPWGTVAMVVIVGLLWFSLGEPATCRAMGGPAQIQVVQRSH